MTDMKDRGQAAESMYALNDEREFKALARRNKLLGLWAAEHLGMEGATAESYAMDVVKSDLEEHGDEDVYRKVKGDLDAKGANVSEHRVRKAMAKLLIEARQQIISES